VNVSAFFCRLCIAANRNQNPTIRNFKLNGLKVNRCILKRFNAKKGQVVTEWVGLDVLSFFTSFSGANKKILTCVNAVFRQRTSGFQIDLLCPRYRADFFSVINFFSAELLQTVS
jgi:hypothetical protein